VSTSRRNTNLAESSGQAETSYNNVVRGCNLTVAFSVLSFYKYCTMLYPIYSILQYFVHCDCRHQVVDDVDQNKTHFQSLEVGFTNEA